MRAAYTLALFFAGFLLLSHSANAQTKSVANFRLEDAAGQKVALDDFKDKKAVVVLFLGTHCPINNAYAPRLAALHAQFADKRVQFLAINSNADDTAEAIAEHARKHKIPFPVLRDPVHTVADLFAAERTPEAFVLDEKRTIRYQGRIDDQFGIGFQRPKATRNDLALAVEEVLANKDVGVAKTAVAGCLIGRAPRPKEEAKVTYAKDVAPILQRRCQECHRPNHIGPMSLMTYRSASSWAAMIKEVVTEKRMPPWHADPQHGSFRNDRRLTKEEYDTLLAWIDQGCPQGDPKDAPPPRQFAEGWAIGQPDQIFSMPREFKVPAQGPKSGVRYQNFRVDTNFQEDKWIQAVEARPGNRAVVHHIIVYVLVNGKRLQGAEDGIGQGFLVAYAPGDFGVSLPPGAAKRIPKGATLMFQMHYTPNGAEQTDRSSVGLVFAKKPPEHEVRTRAIAQQLFFIPPGKDDQRVTSSSTFRKDALLWSLMPHMHLRGKSFKYEVVYPGGKREVLLDVPKYDFSWQDNYFFKEPLQLPAGTRIECTAHFDNSKNNPSNPDPAAWVRWGDQTWEEMMIGFVNYTYVEKKD